MHYFCIFFKKFNKPCVNFFAFGRKTQIVGKFSENLDSFWWKFYWKIAFLFYFYFGKFVTKNRASGNNTIFYTICSVSWESPPFPPPPGYALALQYADSASNHVDSFIWLRNSKCVNSCYVWTAGETKLTLKWP